LDVDGLTFAAAMTAEEKIARRLGPTVRVGLAARNGVPTDTRLVSFGIAGSLRGDLPIGTVIDATRVVDESGETLWEGSPLGVAGATTGTILGATRIVDDPGERRRLRDATGADAVDMESGPLARSGRLAGCIRAISDTPDRRLGGIAHGAKSDGRVDVPGLLAGFAREPRVTFRAAMDARRALKALEAVA
jgi:adenosylhomocysteine nucleosidase